MISIGPKKIHHVRLIANNSFLRFFIDRKLVFTESVKDYTKGFLSFETTETNTDITDLSIKKGDIKQERINVRQSDIKHERIEIENMLTGEIIIQRQHKAEEIYCKPTLLKEYRIINFK
ncbi:MAG: hypothetical protein KAK00_03530 [Nanoarchaeota archaeon]|nr:hypothetical protein [Nanoarchaeota archaeon]